MAKSRRNTVVARKILLARAANRCSYPGCNAELIDSSGIPIAELCHIEAITRGGPRYNPERFRNDAHGTEQLAVDLDNLIVLCPNHHRLVDADPIRHSAEWLRKAREDHERSMVSSLQVVPDLPSLAKKVTSFRESLKIWKANALNGDEEFWHQLFVANPRILAQAVPNCIFQIGEKCFVGGKGISNHHGKIADFVYATKSTQNVVIVEIKAPTMPLIGPEYRADIFSISEHLSGSVVQVLTYRNQLLKHFHSLKGSSDAPEFEAFDPICLVLAGNLEIEMRTAAQRASFDLFRANAGVLVITYDELFAKIQDLVDMLDDDAGSASG